MSCAPHQPHPPHRPTNPHVSVAVRYSGGAGLYLLTRIVLGVLVVLPLASPQLRCCRPTEKLGTARNPSTLRNLVFPPPNDAVTSTTLAERTSGAAVHTAV